MKKFTHTEETKKVMSIKRKEYLKNNPDKHPWKNNSKFKSIPCEVVKDFLKNKKIDFIEEYQPLYPNRFFSIDIAFPDKKIGIEINGNQHYDNNGTLVKYYKDRHDLIETEDWKLYEFHYSAVYNKCIFLSIDDILKGSKVKVDFDYKFWISDKKIKQKLKKEKREKKQKEKREKIDKKVNELINSDIDFSKFGWVQKTCEILNMEPQCVNRWMKKNMIEFYEDNCFKRKI